MPTPEFYLALSQQTVDFCNAVKSPEIKSFYVRFPQKLINIQVVCTSEERGSAPIPL